MKRIVSATLVVGTQLLIGILFLVMLFSNKEENKTIVLANNNLNKKISAVPTFISNDIVESVQKDIIIENKEEEKKQEIKEEEHNKIKEEENIVEENNVVLETPKEYSVIETYVGKLTGYGPNCVGCSGLTACDYDVKNTTTYIDDEYGEIRILAADKTVPFYSIIRISNVEGMDPIIAIVLDRGGTVGFAPEKITTFDLLFSSESEANANMGLRQNVTFELLRSGK